MTDSTLVTGGDKDFVSRDHDHTHNAVRPSAHHTPGPWLLEDDDWGHRICMGDAITSPYDHETQNLIKYEHGCTPDQEPEQYAQALANARLIAAAPDLLGALEGLAEYVEGIAAGFSGDPAFAVVRAWAVQRASHARSAIAKAVGTSAPADSEASSCQTREEPK